MILTLINQARSTIPGPTIGMGQKLDQLSRLDFARQGTPGRLKTLRSNAPNTPTIIPTIQIQIFLDALVNNGYPKEILNFDYESITTDYQNVIWDISNGTILSLGRNKFILEARCGNRCLN